MEARSAAVIVISRKIGGAAESAPHPVRVLSRVLTRTSLGGGG